jgi:hypothetical protein
MKQLLSSSIAAPGFFGLNTQESSITLSSGYALQADNCVIDNFGRLGSRKGHVYKTSSGGTGTNLRGIHDFIDASGHVDYVSWGGTDIYKGLETLTALTTGITITGDDWQAASLGDSTYLAQAGHPMLKVNNSLVVSTHSTAQYSFVTSAYGRLWAGNESADRHTLHCSDLLNGAFNGGSSFDLDLRKVWTKGGDELVSVAGFNGLVFVFCKKSIVILGDTNNTDLTITPTTLRVVEVLDNVGCVSRSSIQAVGDDLFFLSDTGLRSLNRVIQEKSNPITDLSANVRDELTEMIASSSSNHINTIYSPVDAFYLLVFPAAELVYCFDTRGRLENGGLRVTKWPNSSILCGTATDTALYFGMADGISQYQNYQDDGASYFMAYHTNYFDFDQPTVTKILKTVGVTLIGGSGQTFVVKVGTDYSDQPRSYVRSVKQSSTSEYNVAEYNEAEFTGGGSTDRIKVAIGGQGSVLQLGFEADISGDQLSIQKFDVYVKQGRTN